MILQNFPQMVTEWLASPWLANIIAVASFFVALFALYRSKKTARKMLSIEETREKDRVNERRSASLTAEVIKRPIEPLVVIKNQGQATAKDIKVLFDEVPFDEHVLAIRGISRLVGTIGPGSRDSIKIQPTMANDAPFKVEITWTDDSNEPGRFSGELSPI